MIATIEGRAPELRWSEDAAVCVVAASGGYPGAYKPGIPIRGLERAQAPALVFHAGTATRDGQLVTAGGRVLNVVGVGSTIEDARARAYAGLSTISFEGMQFRTDIGAALPETVREGASVS